MPFPYKYRTRQCPLITQIREEEPRFRKGRLLLIPEPLLSLSAWKPVKMEAFPPDQP